jgi:hypothetical protein
MRPAPRAAAQRNPPVSRHATRAGTRASPAKPVKPTPPPTGGPQREGGGKSGAARARARPRAPGPPHPVPPPPRAAKPEGSAAPRPELAHPAVPPGSGIAASGGRAERDNARTTAARKGPVCQIRWVPRGRGSRFHAVTIGPDGVERALASSPRLDWDGPSPPEQSPEAQAALQQLAKQLRDNGWRPMRAKGRDFNEERWYATRFRRSEPPAEKRTGTPERRVQ